MFITKFDLKLLGVEIKYNIIPVKIIDSAKILINQLKQNHALFTIK